MTTFALAGFGYRAAAFHRVAQALPEVRCVGAVVRAPHRRTLPVPAFGDLADCLRDARPDFLVTAVPAAANPGIVTDAVARGLPVLAETPPAPDLPGPRALWAAAGPSGLVQVAEQYLLMPAHAARLAAVRSGIIGTARTITRTPLVRRNSGHDLDLNGFDTETIAFGGEVLYRNRYLGLRFNDDEIATATLLDAMAAWMRGTGPPPYPLAEGAQDHALALAIERAADTGREVTTTAEAWSL